MTSASGCVSRWGGQLPRWVCTLGGRRTPEEVTAWLPVAVGAVSAVLALSAAGAAWSWRRSGLPFRDWWDSLR